MSKRDEYRTLIYSRGIRDFLSEIEELSYSKKVYVLNKLLEQYSPYIINMALNEYETNYVATNRVVIPIMEKVLLGICKKIKEKLS